VLDGQHQIQAVSELRVKAYILLPSGVGGYSKKSMSLLPASLYDLSFSQMEELLVSEGVRPAHCRTLWRALHRRPEVPLQERGDFLPPLVAWLRQREQSQWALPGISVCTDSSDGMTRKLLLQLRDEQRIETVIMRYEGRSTACLSTQVGCAMGCVFCATGQGGFTRHLTVGEIVTQVIHAQMDLRARGLTPLRNLVLMGMGEPLHNYENVMQALGIITDTRAANLGAAKISISTVGVVPSIRRMAEEGCPYNLAVSLHAATDAERSALVPANRRWPLAELMDACRYYCEKKGRRIFFEWTLIEGKNDSEETALKVAGLLQGLDAHLNLIPLNPTAGYEGLPSVTEAGERFHRIIQDAGFPCTFRQRRGIDVAAGCGQLAGAAKKRASRTTAETSGTDS
jgi:23S rRNA (adenine2503-C2)-methyltransferase